MLSIDCSMKGGEINADIKMKNIEVDIGIHNIVNIGSLLNPVN